MNDQLQFISCFFSDECFTAHVTAVIVIHVGHTQLTSLPQIFSHLPVSFLLTAGYPNCEPAYRHLSVVKKSCKGA